MGGRSRACDVRPGDRLWTLRDGRTEPTTVVDVRVATTRAVLDVTTTHTTFAVMPEQLLLTPDGWTRARHRGCLDTCPPALQGTSIHPAVLPVGLPDRCDRECFDGFLDGYADGDGCRIARWPARILVSANIPFLTDLAGIIGARFTPDAKRSASPHPHFLVNGHVVGAGA
ncbi:hypothetical protein [Streptomyces sp. NPDC060010]|uniref:hypothetical protein n=1 Tax=Streptomyces sp. NPDC060010 TaxID=3347036 RepID=UPI00367FFE7F